MLTLPQLMEIEHHLASLPVLVDEYQSHHYNFQEHAMDWLTGLETILSQSLPYLVPEISILRVEITLSISAREFDKHRNNPSISKHKRRVDATADAVRKAGERVVNAIKGIQEILQSGEQIARQIAAIAQIKGIGIQSPRDWNAALAAWDRISADTDLISVAIHLVGLVGRSNAILLYINASDTV